MRRLPGALAVVAGALLLLACVAHAAEPVKIRVGWVVVPANLPPILFAKQGVAKHLGQSYDMDPIHFNGTPLMISALASGELDIGLLAYSSFALAVENAGMRDLRIIADDFQDGVEGYYTNEYMVRQDSPIRTVEDLKGKVLASNAAGSAVDVALRVMLRKHGLDDKKDLSIIEVAFPNMKAVLAEKKVDLISGVVPFSVDPGLKEIARTLFTQKDAVGTTEMIIWAARAPFLEKNRAAMVDFMEDELRALRFYRDPANHREVVDIIAQYTKQPRERFDSWVFTKGGDYYRDPDGLPNLDALQANIDTQRELGLLKSPLDVKKYAVLDIVKEAAQRLK
jgi:NitT/TauT family transport system substrate-binding protein